jgi:leucyl aminopeptidase
MPNLSDTALCFDRTRSATATTLHVVRATDYARWAEEQSPAIKRWLTSTQHRGDAGTIAWLPDDAAPSVLAVVGPDPLYALGDLPYRLPGGTYRARGLTGPSADLLVLGWGLGAYRYTRYKTADRTPARLVVPDECADALLRDQLDAIALVRDLINAPANDMLPQQLADAAAALANEFGATCSVTVGDALLANNFPTIHAVGRASTCPPRLIDVAWGDPAHPLVTLIGKGVCFDSGGLDIKASNGMRLMKKDMGGAAHVLGIAHVVMAQRLSVRLRVLIPAVENAIDGNAYRPGDIIRTRKGTTVEIDNTDAEGRLVLCDAIALACEDRPGLIIDFATLTGAARTALGTDVPALFCNDDGLADGLIEASRRVADPLWRMPLHQPYKKMLASYTADLVNSASSPYAGAITAALFLEAFVAPNVPWAHFDLMAWNTSTSAGRPEGGEAMGLRAVYAHLASRFGG